MSSNQDKYCVSCEEDRRGKFCCECGSKLSEKEPVKIGSVGDAGSRLSEKGQGSIQFQEETINDDVESQKKTTNKNSKETSESEDNSDNAVRKVEEEKPNFSDVADTSIRNSQQESNTSTSALEIKEKNGDQNNNFDEKQPNDNSRGNDEEKEFLRKNLETDHNEVNDDVENKKGSQDRGKKEKNPFEDLEPPQSKLNDPLENEIDKPPNEPPGQCIAKEVTVSEKVENENLVGRAIVSDVGLVASCETPSKNHLDTLQDLNNEIEDSDVSQTNIAGNEGEGSSQAGMENIENFELNQSIKADNEGINNIENIEISMSKMVDDEDESTIQPGIGNIENAEISQFRTVDDEDKSTSQPGISNIENAEISQFCTVNDEDESINQAGIDNNNDKSREKLCDEEDPLQEMEWESTLQDGKDEEMEEIKSSDTEEEEIDKQDASPSPAKKKTRRGRKSKKSKSIQEKEKETSDQKFSLKPQDFPSLGSPPSPTSPLSRSQKRKLKKKAKKEEEKEEEMKRRKIAEGKKTPGGEMKNTSEISTAIVPFNKSVTDTMIINEKSYGDFVVIDSIKNEEVVSLHFYVTFLAELKDLLEDYNLHIVFGFRNWLKSPSQKMQCVKTLKQGNLLFHLVVKFARGILLDKEPYKYVLLPKKTRDALIWENLHEQSDPNRVFCLTGENLYCSTFYQVDDIFLPPIQKSLFQRFLRFIRIPSEGEKIREWKRKYTNVFINLLELCDNKELPLNDPSNFSTVMFKKSLCRGFFQSSKHDHTIDYFSFWKKLPEDKQCKEAVHTRCKRVLKENLLNLTSSQASTDDEKIDCIISSITQVMYLKDIKKFDDETYMVFFKSLSVENLKEDFIKAIPKRLKKKFGSFTKYILMALIEQWKYAVSMKDRSLSTIWCYPLVLIHLFYQELQSSEIAPEFPRTFDSTTCGLHGLPRWTLEYEFLNETFNNLDRLQTCLRVDPYLQLSLLYVMRLRHLVKVVESGNFAKDFVVKTISSFMSTTWKGPDCITDINVALTQLNSSFDNHSTSKLDSKELCKLVLAHIDFVNSLGMNVLFDETSSALYTTAIECTTATFQLLKRTGDKDVIRNCGKSISDRTTLILHAIENFLNLHVEWINQEEKDILQELNFFDKMFQLEVFQDVPGFDFKRIATMLHNLLVKNTEQLFTHRVERFLNLYGKLNNYNMGTSDIFQENCERLLKNLFSAKSDGTHFAKVIYYLDQGETVFVKALLTEWHQAVNPADQLRLILMRPLMREIFKFFYGDPPEYLRKMVRDIESVLRKHFVLLENASLTLEGVAFLKQERNEFLDAFKFCVKLNEFQNAQKVLEQRFKELDRFNNLKVALQYTIDFCGEELISKIDILAKISQELEVEVIEMQLKETKAHFSVKPDFEQFILALHNNNILTTFLFKQFFWSSEKPQRKNAAMFYKMMKISEKQKRFPKDISIADLFGAPLNQLAKFMTALLGQDITLGEAIKRFTDNADKTLDELNRLCLFFNRSHVIRANDAIVKLTSKKIIAVLKSKECEEVAKEILYIQKELNLKGDFNSLKNLKKKVASEPARKLSEITEDYCNDIEAIHRDKINLADIYTTITESLPFIKWLRKTLKGSHEIKTSVDMMKNAAGDNNEEIYLVKYFDECCSAFIPVLFGLDERSSFAEFQDACNNVKENIGNNRALLLNMCEVNKALDWFKDAYKSQTSFSTGALMETKNANRFGSYLIGNHNKEINEFLTTTIQLDQVISFRVRVTKGGTEIMETRSLSDINDLQSRLMLLGHASLGEGNERTKDDMEIQFSLKHADLAKQLGSAYVSLCEAGDASFFDWSFHFQFNIEGGQECFIEVQHQINRLENRLSEWKKELEAYRDRFPLTNFFSNKQCLVLRKQLHPLKESMKNLRTIPPQVFTLLKFVNKNVSPKAIERAFYASFLDYQEDERDDWKTAESNDDSNFMLLSKPEIKKYLKELVDEYAIDETVAKASFINMIPFVMNDAIIWCQKQRDPDSDKMYDDADTFDDELDKLYTPEDDMTDSDEEDIKLTNLSEYKYLELEQLGKFTSELKKISRDVGRRSPYFVKDEEKKISLLIIPRNEILKAVTQIYLHNGDFPNPGEVLLCNDNVTSEQIDLFIKCVTRTDTGLYCMAFADSLPYSLCETVIESLRKNKHKDMNHLVIICTKENETQSHLPSAMESHLSKDFATVRNDSLLKMMSDRLATEQSDSLKAADIDEKRFNARIIKSERGGMGKSMYVNEKKLKLEKKITEVDEIEERRRRSNKDDVLVVIPVHDVEVKTDDIVDLLCSYEEQVENIFPRIYHFDIAPLVRKGLDNLVFNIVLLGCLQTRTGKVWRKNDSDLCIFEITKQSGKKAFDGYLLSIVPTIKCCSPEEAVRLGKGDELNRVSLSKLKTVPYQRVYHYLWYYTMSGNLADFFYVEDMKFADHRQILELLINLCGIANPSWLELQNFVFFFNKQLIDFEMNCYANNAEEFPGFKTFVVKFMLLMAKDFATRSLTENDETNHNMVELRRRWEQCSHPYLFFNEDRSSFSFFGFNMSPHPTTQLMNLLDPDTREVIEENFMSPELFNTIQVNMQTDIINLQTNINELDRLSQLMLMARVLGVEDVWDPDPTYELTSDNMKKILAIHMRQRCGIPVILMGETGCGKTRLIRYLGELRAGASNIQNMVLIKVHGGVTAVDIEKKIKKTKKIAKNGIKKFLCYCRRCNYDDLFPEEKYHIDEEVNNHLQEKAPLPKEHILRTILFLDEANTSEAIGLIKEIMIDKTVNGKPCHFERYGIDVIAACNPYRRHTKEMMERLESAGLGYHVNEEQSYEKFGDIPLRHLVYRVHPLPESMKPLVWDFGTLNENVESRYSKQIIEKCIQNKLLPANDEFKAVLLRVLIASQQYMKIQKNECSFVSLRDIERAVLVTSWFFDKMDLFLPKLRDYEIIHEIRDEDEEGSKHQVCLDKLRRSLLLAIAVCYIAKLEERNGFVRHVRRAFTGAFSLPNDTKEVLKEIARFQRIFVEELDLKGNIAKNQALCENIFMMVVCIELRIPLFIIGKPGSSKSLAKIIIQDNMQGSSSRSPLFRNFKRITVTSYQCSPHSTSEGIINVFKQASKYQEGKNLDEYTSVVVLDEVGLAEDSPRMPLKALHPLLEDGTDGSEDLTLDGTEAKEKRVSFVGISNWALDPAKMNRGILLSRSPPDEKELLKTARDICAGDERIKREILPILKPLADAYFALYREQKETEILKSLHKEEFFGLRDFYCLVKMIFCFAKKHGRVPPLHDIELAVKRNFSGLKEVDPWSFFEEKLLPIVRQRRSQSEAVSTLEMIRSSIDVTCPCSKDRKCASSRYLLIMTENYSALPMIENLLEMDGVSPDVIFGSSFPQDQEFTQVCRDINRMKICMETGKTIILLNMEKLYESLYDALNQYYVYLGGHSYVDLGLGTHRVKCRVHDNFRLIVIANKQVVYKTFPIPLINRLEKHFLMMSSGLTDNQKILSDQLHEWAHDMATVTSQTNTYTPADAFVGFNDDTCPSIIMHLCQEGLTQDDQILEEGKRTLLNIATPDAIFRVGNSKLKNEKDAIAKIYLEEQQHACLAHFINAYDFNAQNPKRFIQVSTFSSLLSSSPDKLTNSLNRHAEIKVLDIIKCKTEFDFRQDLERNLREADGNHPFLLIVQHSETEKTGDIIACAQHICKETLRKFQQGKIFILFLVQLNSTIRAFRSSVGHRPTWECVHIDDIRSDGSFFSLIKKCQGTPMSALFDLEQAKETGVITIIQNSIQPAMKKVNETKYMDPDSISKKIKLIHELLGEYRTPNYDYFATLMLNFMKKALEETESLNLNPRNWMLNAASEQQHRLHYGTFRAAIISCIERKIAPIWEEFLGIVDQGDNLLLFDDEDYQELWILLLEKVLINKNVEVEHVMRKTDYTARFPFSSFILGSLRSVMRDHSKRLSKDDKTKDAFYDLQEVLDNSPYMELLEDLNPLQLSDFTMDIVSNEYPRLTGDMYKILHEGLRIGVEELKAGWEMERRDGDDPDDEENARNISVTKTLMAYHSYHVEIKSTATMLECQPGIVKEVKRDLKNAREMMLDLQTLRRSLVSFQPTNEQASRREVSLAGNNKMKELKALVVDILKTAPENEGSEKFQLFMKCRLLWVQLRVLQLFEINVCPITDENQPFEKEAVFSFWRALRDLGGEMTSIDSWNKIERFLQNVLQENSTRRNRADGHKDLFKRKCAQFYVDLVEEFCFCEDKKNEEVIQKIMGYTFSNDKQQTRRFSPIAGGDDDKAPVIRSFILQQLMKRDVNVDQYLDQYLTENLRFAENNDNAIWNVCKLFINCYEDNQSSELTGLKGRKIATDGFIRQLSQLSIQSITYLKQNQNVQQVNVELLKNVARARIVITSTCKLLCDVFINQHEDVDEEMKNKLKAFFPHLISFVTDPPNTDIHLFVLRQIVFEHGNRELTALVTHSQYNWLNLQYNQANRPAEVSSDKFLVYGEPYKTMRDQISQLILRNNVENVAVDALPENDMIVNLALIREFGMTNLQQNEELFNAMTVQYRAQEAHNARQLLSRFPGNMDVKELLYHLTCVLKLAGHGMLTLYASLSQRPVACQGWYLPTMPSDDFEMIANVQPGNRGAFVPHACPNGHIYVITECGRAYTESNCPECGARIGGLHHQLDNRNRRVNARNNTLPGHSLGTRNNRPQFAAPERQLSLLSTALQRILLHLSLLLGSLETGQQNIMGLISNAVNVNDTDTFFVQHVLLDLRLLREVMGKNNEDIQLVVHLFIKHLKGVAAGAQGTQYDLSALQTHDGRTRYENEFHRQFVENFISTYPPVLENVKRICVDDLRIGNDPLARRLYEIGGQNENRTTNFNPMQSAQLWRYRQPISIGNMRMKLQENFVRDQSNRLLHQFLAEEKLYVNLKELPKLMEFHEILHQHFKYKLDRKTAKEMSIGELMNDLKSKKRPNENEMGKQLLRLFKSVSKVWNNLSPGLAERGAFKPDPNCHPEKFDNKTKLEYFLCSNEKAGRCLKSVITYLIANQNEFLALYQRMDGSYLKKIDLHELKDSSVINYTPERDLLPIIYLHCDYSLEIGQGTKMEYNINEIERRFMEKICYGKCFIEKSVGFFKFRDDVHSAQELINMENKVPQKKIPLEEQRQMMQELRQIDQVSNALKAVETAIGFISTHGGSPNQLYKEYLDNKLLYNSKQYLASKTMQQNLRLTHLCSAWLMLTVERAIRLFGPDQNPFAFGEHHNLFVEPMGEDLTRQCHDWLGRYDKHDMMGILTEYMVCELPKKGVNDADFELHEALDLYVTERKLKEPINLEFDKTIPNELQLKHIYSFWCIIANVYKRN